MIQGPEYIFLENPGSASSAVSNVLMSEALGFRITPRFDRLPEKPENYTVFTVVRNPLTRWRSLWYYLDGGYTSFSEWFLWLEEKSSPELGWLLRPQTYYAEQADRIIYYEDLYRGFKRITFDLGYNISLPRIETVDRPLLTQEDESLIYCQCKDEFETLGYDGYNWVPKEVKKKPGRPPKTILTPENKNV